MTKSISVAVELLDQLAGMELDTTERSIKIQDELRAILAHPAEAEGVELTGEYHADCNRLIAALSAVTAERDAAQKDAERYRWLRSVGGRTYSVTTTGEKVSGGIYDHCVDAAMAAKEA